MTTTTKTKKPQRKGKPVFIADELYERVRKYAIDQAKGTPWRVTISAAIRHLIALGLDAAGRQDEALGEEK
jgi:hypothetical protein